MTWLPENREITRVAGAKSLTTHQSSGNSPETPQETPTGEPETNSYAPIDENGTIKNVPATPAYIRVMTAKRLRAKYLFRSAICKTIFIFYCSLIIGPDYKGKDLVAIA